jgi:fermentation-respiration switch protein FrsA (DUF1100 family)
MLLFGGCDLDKNLFNAEKIGSYTLPGNTIPDSLITQVKFQSGGNTLYGYWVASDGSHKNRTILYCHGNKHNIDEYWDRVMYLHRLGVNVFIFDYRGFGMSSGESSEDGLHQDGIAALQYIRAAHTVADSTLCLYGYSLGNVVSIYLSAEIATPYRLIAESPFASAASLTQGSLVLDIPSGWLTTGKFDNASEIKKIKSPLLLIHGSDDDFVRFRDNGQVVFDNAPAPKELVLVQGAKHTDVPETMGIPVYLDTLKNFLSL